MAPSTVEDESLDPAFERLLLFLKESRAFDFTGYKRASLMRRVRHEMESVGLESFEDYYDYLQVHPEEFVPLFNTILINVTSFFRDSDAWNYLSTAVVPQLLADAGSAPLRLWSAGCATGQEAYSLAMIFAEHLGLEEYHARVKIYATDVDEDALATARHAVYAERELTGLPKGYLEKYFEPNSTGYAVTKPLRRPVIFGRNDLVQDAPISRIDLLACRNALMYFNAETQARIVSRLGFALRPAGVLFLGRAEMLLNHTGSFEPIDLPRRFFRKVARTAEDEQSTPISRRVRAAAPDETAQRDQLVAEAVLNSPVAQLVIGPDDRVALVNHRAASLLGLSERDVGRPFQDLEVSYRPVELRSHISNARDSRLPVRLREVEWYRPGADRTCLDVHVAPLLDGRSRLLGVGLSFTDVSHSRQLRDELELANRRLETAHEELQSTNEELETTNEELQSTVEELETTNEELQSTNEELETMNEELQSMNDELQTSNADLGSRSAQLSSANEFLDTIIGSLAAAVIVLNRDLIVQVWNRHAEDLWGLRTEEVVGQHLMSLDSGLPTDQLRPIVREVIIDGAGTGEQMLQAVNRRGRTVQVRVRVSALQPGKEHSQGALLLMETVEG